ncbi:MAG: hypothetical protein ABIL09_08565 [Gemmatimonadota bacterium]
MRTPPRAPTFAGMLDSLLTLFIGVAGTLLYLRAWRGLLPPAPAAGESAPRPARHRRRLVQALFLLGLTPYILFLFYLMEQVSALVDRAAGAPL